ncbi:hypothetical protein ACK28Q_06190 [Bradyrhizobium japonicum]|nr:hypothetical protein [Bradyrhizobium japonicum]KMJ95046.1 hypothetical protein CF64_34115 [Bradyrhizobium japonicum]MCS3986862.1 hypothetical protein [Bradyrhizobium japonicum]MCS4018320.1 hypothetical protein [Bradyrhizobium japonicum]MDH6178724.1 hypothetical protein [Bradyrhizobium japonicum]GEC47296.1 hypothetical protein BJA01nite_49380 [Bradyrhizobium japonicum]
MSQTFQKNKNSNDNTTPAKIITSPNGKELLITPGNRWKFRNAVQSDTSGRYSRLQKDITFALIDLTNEGFGEDRSKWGYAYPGFPQLAERAGCCLRSAKKNIGMMEDKGLLIVRRSAGKRASGKRGKGGGGGRDNDNEYFLNDWEVYGRVGNGEPVKFTKEGLISAAWMNRQISGVDDSEAENESGVLVNFWEWNKDEFKPAVDMHGFDENELDEEIDFFIKHHGGERRLDWSPDWLAWIKTREVHARQQERVRQRISHVVMRTRAKGASGSSSDHVEDVPF